MNTLKAYHINQLEAQVKQLQQEYARLRELIRLGDMLAVEEIAQLRKNIDKLRDKIENYRRAFQNTEIEVFLYALSTLLTTLLDTHQNVYSIKEERSTLPWKREVLLNNHKLTLSNKSSTSKMFDINRSEVRSQSKSRLSNSLSQKNINSRQSTRFVIERETRKQKNELLKKNEQVEVQKSTKIQKDTIYDQQNRGGKQRRRTEDLKAKKNPVQSNKDLGNLVTIKIGPAQFQEILKLKNALLNQISFGS